MDKARILIVDDEPNVTAALKRHLHHEPVVVFSASSGREALEILAREAVDVVVSDEQMPGMRGCDLLAEVYRRHPESIRIMLTGHATLEAAVRAINEGHIHRFFTKPCDPADLVVTIRQALAQRELALRNSRARDAAGGAPAGSPQAAPEVLAAALAGTGHSALLRERQLALLERQHPGITAVRRDDDDAVVLDVADLATGPVAPAADAVAAPGEAGADVEDGATVPLAPRIRKP